MNNWTGYIILSDGGDGYIKIEKILKEASYSKAINEINALIVTSLSVGFGDEYKLMMAHIDEKDNSIITYLEQLSDGDEIWNNDKIQLLLNYVEYTDYPCNYIDDILYEGRLHQIEKFSYEDIAKILDIDLDIVKKNFVNLAEFNDDIIGLLGED